MKIVTLIARLLLGLGFVVFGLNGFLNFLTGPMPTGLAGEFARVLAESHFFWVVAAIQILGGALLLVNRFVPLGLVLLAPVIFNILAYHALLDPAGIVPGIVVTILWFIIFNSRRQYFSGIFVPRTSD